MRCICRISKGNGSIWMAFFISGIYYICYGQKILRLSVEEPLTKEQIQVVEERLKLKE